MRRQLLEARVLQIVETSLNGRAVEDDRVECKSTWPLEYRRAARWIAGHANAAGGEPILWIIGLDDDAGRLVEPSSVDPAEWWPRVARCFDELAPEAAWLNVTTPSGPVTAVEFATNRAPYLITREGGGPEREVPWRDATTTRSARRSEILRSVLAEAAAPHLAAIAASARLALVGGELQLNVQAQAYLEAHAPADLPEYRWQLTGYLGGHEIGFYKKRLHVNGPTERVSTGGSQWHGMGREIAIGSVVYVDGSALHVGGSDVVRIMAYHRERDADDNLVKAARRAQRFRLELVMPVGLSERAATLDMSLKRARLRPLSERRKGQVEDIRVAEFTLDGMPHPQSYEGGSVV